MATENSQPIKGQKAYSQILLKLSGNLLAKKLAKEIFDFYGDFLTYSETRERLSSTFTLNFQHEPSMLFDAAEIILKLDTTRESEALAHELLHLQLPIRGFLILVGTSLPDEMPKESAKIILDMYVKITNIVQHEIFMKDFKALGYLKSNFIGPVLPPQIDYSRVDLELLSHPVYTPHGFSWWCLEYFRHWMNMRMGKTLEAEPYAKGALQWGSKQHPLLNQAAKEMTEWVKLGIFKRPEQYVQQVNYLLEIMKIPQATMWASLECSEPHKPIAKLKKL